MSAIELLRRRRVHARQRRRWAALRRPGQRDMTPAVGTHGGPGPWKRADANAPAPARPQWQDARWSFLYKDDTDYAQNGEIDRQAVAAAAARMRAGEVPDPIQGPLLKPPVWTWEIPLYFWFGGMASGAAFASLACELSGDQRSALWARRVALAALVPSPPLLIADLGRPERFYNMLRVFKPRSPMNMGAWALTVFGALAAGGVGADLLERPRAARACSAGTAVVGGYLGSYAGVLLASTAVPLWARSRSFLGPIFVATATATGAAATRIVVVLAGLPADHSTRTALERVESGAMVAETLLSEINRRRLGPLASTLHEGRQGRLFRMAQALVASGLATRAVTGSYSERARHVGSVCFLASALCFRYAWVVTGPSSAQQDAAVAARARGRVR